MGRGQTFAIHRLFSIATLRELLGQRKKPFQALVLIFGATEKNLLKLFEWLVEVDLAVPPPRLSISQPKERVIY